MRGEFLKRLLIEPAAKIGESSARDEPVAQRELVEFRCRVPTYYRRSQVVPGTQPCTRDEQERLLGERALVGIAASQPRSLDNRLPEAASIIAVENSQRSIIPALRRQRG